MDSLSSRTLHPAMLPQGTVLGSWRVAAWSGSGVYGVVYRAVPSHDPHAAPVALKLALHPEDPRFSREAELLSRCQHPSIPRLLDHGFWQSPAGTLHPFLVMQWIDGVPLYDQVRLHPVDPPQVRLWLAQLAQALAVLHAQGAVHRDVKGGNILVRRSDGRAMLVDFGTGLHPGAATLTPPLWFPGTPAYRSPESALFELQFHRDASTRYHATPADDLYSLGVTVCRLLTGEYPEFADPSQDEHGTWRLESLSLPLALLSESQIEPSLRVLILRLLSIKPEQRGTAAQLAEELAPTSGGRHSTNASRAQVSLRREELWLLPAAAASLALALWAGWSGSSEMLEEISVKHAELSGADSADAGTAGLGEAATALVTQKAPAVSNDEGMSEGTLPEPLPGQVRPDEKGRCPRKGLVALNGGCWAETTWEPETCLTLGGQMFKGTCYVPFIPRERGRPPTSAPMTKP